MFAGQLWKSVFAAFLTIIAVSTVSVRSCEAATEYLLYTFCTKHACADGAAPHAGVHRVRDKLYAVTTINNKNNTGSVLAIKGSGDAKIINDTAEPGEAPIEVNNTLYGTTTAGGPAGAGTLYAFRDHKLTVLYSFCAKQYCSDGAFPQAQLIAANGLLYGTTVFGGMGGCGGSFLGCGTVFSFDPATGTEKVVYAFCSLTSCADGSKPQASVNEVAGFLYGTTSTGGQAGKDCADLRGCGTVFRLDPTTGDETVLHAFASRHDGREPAAPLVNVRGILYGTTQGGGSDSSCTFEGVSGWVSGCGTVFSIDLTSGVETIVHSFLADGKDGQNPVAGLTKLNGLLYGTTVNGGAGLIEGGTVFSVNLKDGSEDVVYSFCSQYGCYDGYRPYGKLLALQGELLGTTSGGGDGYNLHHQITGTGAIFVIVP